MLRRLPYWSQMDNLLTTSTSRGLDKFTTNTGYATEVQLMRNAGRAIAVETGKLVMGDRTSPIVIICGKGHNGGDGIAAGNFLKRWGYDCMILLTGKVEDMDDTVASICREGNNSIVAEAVPDSLGGIECAVVIDALLGIGVDRDLEGPVKQWVEWINGAAAMIIAADMPTGLNADNGLICGDAVNADITVTMGHQKLGCLVNAGPDFCGRTIIAGIGFNDKYFKDDVSHYFRYTADDFIESYRQPDRRTYKHRQGKALVIAGSSGMTGAAVLAAKSTISTGTGLTVAACPTSLQPLYATAMPEIITLGLEDNNHGMFLSEHVSLIGESLSWADCVIIGPGISRSPQALDFVRSLIPQLDSPALLDADGLAAYNGEAEILNESRVPLVLTPHAKEFAQLFDFDLSEVMADPVGILSVVRSYFSQTVVLKGAPTLILLSTGDIVVNSTGNPGMATAGSGDVLSGVIGTFLSQGYSADEAAMMGVWLHGKAGDIAREMHGAAGLTSLHLLNNLSTAFSEMDIAT